MLIVANFDREKTCRTDYLIPEDILKLSKVTVAEDLLTNKKIPLKVKHKIPVEILPSSAQIIQF
ncbi:hypothetical protein D9M69_733870 [compost metagenome]